MAEQLADSGRALGRGCVLAAALFVLILAANCGHETFYLLSSGGAPSTEAGSPAPGAVNSAVTATGGNFSQDPFPPPDDVSNGGSGGADAGRDAGASSGGNGRQGGTHINSDDGCSSGDSCVDGGVRCPPTVQFCKRCQTQSECTRDGAPFCDVSDGHCAECDPQQDTCPQGEACDSLWRRCAKTCPCDGAHHVCARNVCVDCTEDGECKVVAGHEHFQCFAGFCVECVDNGDCNAPGRICQGYKCVAK